jgi:hypothetical protein
MRCKAPGPLLNSIPPHFTITLTPVVSALGIGINASHTGSMSAYVVSWRERSKRLMMAASARYSSACARLDIDYVRWVGTNYSTVTETHFWPAHIRGPLPKTKRSARSFFPSQRSGMNDSGSVNKDGWLWRSKTLMETAVPGGRM